LTQKNDIFESINSVNTYRLSKKIFATPALTPTNRENLWCPLFSC